MRSAPRNRGSFVRHAMALRNARRRRLLGFARMRTAGRTVISSHHLRHGGSGAKKEANKTLSSIIFFRLGNFFAGSRNKENEAGKRLTSDDTTDEQTPLCSCLFSEVSGRAGGLSLELNGRIYGSALALGRKNKGNDRFCLLSFRSSSEAILLRREREKKKGARDQTERALHARIGRAIIGCPCMASVIVSFYLSSYGSHFCRETIGAVRKISIPLSRGILPPFTFLPA